MEKNIKGKHDQLIVRIVRDLKLTPTSWKSIMDDDAGRMHIKETIDNVIYGRFLLFLGSPKINVLEVIVVTSRVSREQMPHK